MREMANPKRDAIHGSMIRRDGRPVEWKRIVGLADYGETVTEMDAVAASIAAGRVNEQVWLLEHPPLFTAGTRAREVDLVDPDRLPVHRTGRGGEFTYHGPGQRVVYLMLDLQARRRDVRAYVAALERWLIATLDRFNVHGERREDRVGVWVTRPERGTEEKIAAIGIRLRRWVTTHGIALNVEPDLSHYSGIVPCGVSEHGVTSLVDLGLPVTMEDADIALRQAFEESFGPTVDA